MNEKVRNNCFFKGAISGFFEHILPRIGNELNDRINDNFQMLKTQHFEVDWVYIERFWRSIKHEKIKLCEFDDIYDLENLIADYISHYNYERPHQSLGELVPAEVFKGAKKVSQLRLFFVGV